MANPTFGKWLREQRIVRGMTQRDVEEAANLSFAQVSKYERGVLFMPEDDVRGRIHAALGTTEEDLVDAGVLNRLTVGERTVLVSASDGHRYQPHSEPPASGPIPFSDAVREISAAARSVAWTQSMVDSIVKQIEMLGALQAGQTVSE